MNHYRNNFGYHTPVQSEQFAALLTSEGIAFVDASWHNDETDRFTIPFTAGLELHCWIGDPAREDDGFHSNMLSLFNVETGEIDHDQDIAFGTLEELVSKIKELTAN